MSEDVLIKESECLDEISEIKEEIKQLREEYTEHYRKYASWIYPRNKEVRDVMSILPILSASVDAMIEVFVTSENIGKKATKKWLLLLQKNLNKHMLELQEKTGMISTLQGLMIEPKKELK